jgi:hypothetical protein
MTSGARGAQGSVCDLTTDFNLLHFIRVDAGEPDDQRGAGYEGIRFFTSDPGAAVFLSLSAVFRRSRKIFSFEGSTPSSTGRVGWFLFMASTSAGLMLGLRLWRSMTEFGSLRSFYFLDYARRQTLYTPLDPMAFR